MKGDVLVCLGFGGEAQLSARPSSTLFRKPRALGPFGQHHCPVLPAAAASSACAVLAPSVEGSAGLGTVLAASSVAWGAGVRVTPLRR